MKSGRSASETYGTEAVKAWSIFLKESRKDVEHDDSSCPQMQTSNKNTENVQDLVFSDKASHPSFLCWSTY